MAGLAELADNRLVRCHDDVTTIERQHREQVERAERQVDDHQNLEQRRETRARRLSPNLGHTND